MAGRDKRQIFVNGSYAPLLDLQRRFLDAVADECPAVLAELRAEVLPAFEVAARDLQEHPQHGEQFLGLKHWQWVERVSGRQRQPSCAAAMDTLNRWAERWHLRADFVRSTSLHTLVGWARTPLPDGAKLAFLPAVTADYLPPTLGAAPPPSWDVATESEAAFRERISEYVEERRAAALAAGLVPVVYLTGPSELTFQRLARWQVLLESPSSFARADAGNLRALRGRTEDIRRALADLARRLDLPPRRARAGRPRKMKATHAGP